MSRKHYCMDRCEMFPTVSCRWGDSTGHYTTITCHTEQDISSSSVVTKHPIDTTITSNISTNSISFYPSTYTTSLRLSDPTSLRQPNLCTFVSTFIDTYPTTYPKQWTISLSRQQWDILFVSSRYTN